MVTAFYASLLGFVLIKISLDTIKARHRYKVSLGSGNHPEMEKYVSAHSNFVSYVPMLILLMALAEFSGAVHAVLLHFLGLIICLGRIYHYAGITAEKPVNRDRKIGMHLTLWPVLALSLLNLYGFVFKIFS